ncbi:MAG: class I SAM-dependent methyltransferase [Acidobacteriota bacterium]
MNPVLDLIEAFRRSQVLFTAVHLGVFDLLTTGHTAPAIANRLSADLRATELLLDACVNLGLLTKADGRYRYTPDADRYCRRSSPETLAGYMLYSRDVLWHLWANLPDAVREGSHRWPQTFQLDSGADIFGHFFRTPESLRTFQQGMHGFGLLSSPKVVAAFDLSGFHHLCDLGGGTGHLAAAARAHWPRLSASVFDLPAVIAAYPVPGVDGIAGDFFADPLPPADLYALGRIIHDWSTPKVETLLRKIYAALPPGGALLLAEALLDDDHTGPRHALLQSLNMLTCTEGRERSAPEYRALLESIGFQAVETRRTGAPVDAILARKG